ncbi:unnamed protein product, partial [Lymnaea stagnalis]
MFKVFLILAHIIISFGQKITLFDYRQEDSETKCTHGLVSGVDTVVFKSQVDFSQDIKMKYAHFYIQRKMDQIPMLYFDFNIQECVSSQSITCERAGMFLINLTIKVPASREYSGAAISGTLFTSNMKIIFSNTHNFPSIMDSTSTRGWLIVNGHTISNNVTGCDINFNETVLNITYNCESDIKPCLIGIIAAGGGKPSRGKDKAMYILEQELHDLNVTIKHASCTLDGECNILQCRIHQAVKEKDTTSSIKNTVVFCIV